MNFVSMARKHKRKSLAGMPRRTYTMDERMSILTVLSNNDGNISKTARECKIGTTTLKLWREKYGHMVNTEELVSEAVHGAVKTNHEFKNHILPKYHNAIELSIDRLIELIPQATRIDDIVKAMKASSDLAGLTPENMNENEAGDNSVNLYQVIFNTLEKKYKDEENTITLPGDPEE
jgi:transposase-like protein